MIHRFLQSGMDNGIRFLEIREDDFESGFAQGLGQFELRILVPFAQFPQKDSAFSVRHGPLLINRTPGPGPPSDVNVL
jgi:hypothetical protein